MFLILLLNSILNILIFLINFSYVGSLPVEPLLLLESLGETHGLSDFVSGGYVREVEEKRERESQWQGWDMNVSGGYWALELLDCFRLNYFGF